MENREKTVQQFKCPCCSGAIEFDTNLQKMKCPFCDTEFDLDTLKQFDETMNEEQPDHMDWKADSKTWAASEASEMKTYVCQACGGEILVEASAAAAFCPYCGNPVVLEGNVSGELRPDLVIPFKLSKEDAIRAMEQHLSKKKLLPKVFKDENHLQEIKGIYAPFWLYDADCKTGVRCRATRVNCWRDSRFNYTETSHFLVFRQGSLSFSHVPVDGSTRMPNDLMESIEPFDYRDAVDFKTAYLSGFFADRYNESAADCENRVNERIKNSTQSAVMSTIVGYSSVVPENTSVQMTAGKTLYALLPVWILRTEWNGKQYLFAMNGQTGKFVGDLPMDRGAYHRWLWGLTGAVSAGIIGLSLLIHFLF